MVSESLHLRSADAAEPVDSATSVDTAASVDNAASVDTVCGYCGVGCGLTLDVTDGRVSGSRGTKSHPANRGRLCTKGATTADMLNAPGRLTTALVRDHRTGDPRPADVDDAITETARRLTEIRDRHGADSIAVYVSGQMSLESQYLANKLVKGFLGTNQIESNSRLCMASAGTGYKQSLGADGPPGSYDDLDHADAFLVIGSNMAECHPILFLRLLDRVAAGAKLIVVDPRRTATARKANVHLRVRPGSDLALLNGLLRLVVDAGGIDEEFIAAHTTGWESMGDLLDDYPPDRVAELTGVDEAELRAAAEMLLGADNWVSLWTMGLNQSVHGTWNTNAVCNLHLATGTICRPGSGPFSLTGQPNAMGGREMGYMGPGLPGQRTALDAAHRRDVETMWGVPEGTISSDPGGGTIDMFEQMAAGRIKAAWIICTNPVASVANRSVVTAALEKAEFVVVQEAFEGTETSAYADVLLPAALWTEAEGTMVNSERSVSLTRAAVPAPGQARPDWVLISQIARAMGYAAGFAHPDAAAVFDEITGFHNPMTGWDLRGVDYARLRGGPVQWPAAPVGPRRNPIRYLAADDVPRFPTPDGRARFLVRPHLPPAELPDDDYPMVLTTGRVANQWHTMTKTGRVAKLNRLDPEPYIQMHPADGSALGIAAGDLVEVRSRRGLARVRARIDDAIAEGVCFVPMHWGDSFGELLAINAVTSDAVDPDSLQPEFKACAVALTRLSGPAPDLQEPPVPTTASPATATAGSVGLATALGVEHAEPTLSDSERSYLAGLLRGLSANPPDGHVPTVPQHAPLAPSTRDWADGVLAGYFSRLPLAGSGLVIAPAEAAARTIRVVWASQTGTVEGYVPECVAAITEAGFAVTATNADRIGIDDLVGDVVFVVATTGDGEAPDDAVALWDALSGASAQDVHGLRYAVLGFGDSAYADFCGFARKLDARLHTLEAERICATAYCEPDYAGVAGPWVAGVAQAVDNLSAAEPEVEPDAAYSRTNPFPARVVDNLALGRPTADKEVRRIGFELPSGTLEYRAGDALGVWPRNSDALVDEWLRVTGLDGDQPVQIDDRDVALRQALTENFEIARCTRELVAFVGMHHEDAELAALLDDPRALADWAWGRQSVDLLATHPVEASATQWLSVFRRLQPRLYSISSSPAAHPGRVEVTASIVRFGSDDARRQGVCSGFLADTPVGDTARLFVQANTNFGPPADADAPAIMIGPGTGIAPFRAFLHERSATAATGDNWVFFGERHRDSGFYYADELEGFRQSGLLTRLDVAFSRDQEDKVYVQHLMRQNAAEIWAWLRRGAYVYVCGDAKQMARDVDETLQTIIAEHGRLAPSGAANYLRALAAEKRYVRDVY
ncbi:bifunctional nitrate reductase/sulfite reductase flavoprotein subunit alpha [Gordonia sp. (in: high G+C Gram-positive bacteria)]|uniref:bifunctional nitrate reductase/sulfite reductase flavoprotein subunit alpha n=1 Tax=Gordonia sp. (in: high G+C Gram-positive bacteria) TaxID=84139 RepID=UPI001694C759|nr:bifunctional nitrate reductase/sulfite reductase flavoprotein subunit alpha [Gordonia sp. (in: high G+C Gram-positive bacteria)]NLG45831.1 molybdopterin-dependent oxidoreductase [Gordonia sp. (in: high G+C Gram-positive bacteria)]